MIGMIMLMGIVAKIVEKRVLGESQLFDEDRECRLQLRELVSVLRCAQQLESRLELVDTGVRERLDNSLQAL